MCPQNSREFQNKKYQNNLKAPEKLNLSSSFLSKFLQHYSGNMENTKKAPQNSQAQSGDSSGIMS